MKLLEVVRMVEQVYRLTDLEIEEVSLVELGANNKKFVTRKGENGNGKLWFMDGGNMTGKIEKSAEEIEKELKEKLEKELKEKMEKEYSEKIEKEKKEMAEKLEKEKLDLTERLEKAEATAKESLEKAEVEKQARLTKEFIDIAKGMPTLGEAIKVGPVLKEMSEKLSKESYDAVMTILKAADERTKKGLLLQEIGKDGEGVSDSSAYGEIEKSAKTIMDTEKISYTMALQKAIRQNPDLYEKYTNERAKRT